MFNNHFYHGHTRRAVSVFGTLFNNLTIVKTDGGDKHQQTIKVPLSYGPREKFLSRIRNEENLNDPKLAIKLPRMSFQITDLSYDESKRINRGSSYRISKDGDNNSTIVMPYPSTYILSFELSIISKNSDDGLQILEQILPFFQPEYTVTVKEVNDNFRNDMPFTLKSVTMDDDYEGDFNSRRSIIYTLSFDTKINYYGPTSNESSVIKSTKTNFHNAYNEPGTEPLESVRLKIMPQDASEDDEYTIETIYEPKIYESAILYFDSFTDGPISDSEYLIGQESGAMGTASEIKSDSIKVLYPDERFINGETVVGTKSEASFTIDEIEPIWYSRE